MHFQDLVGEKVWTIEMQHHGGIEKNRREGVGRAGVDDTRVVWSRRYAKSILLQAYLECLSRACHSKSRENTSTPRIQTQIVKMLMAKTNLSECEDAYKLCSDLWDDLSLVLIGSQDFKVTFPNKEQLSRMEGREVMIRLAVLADFYRYQKEDLGLNEEESTEKLHTLRATAVDFLTNRLDIQPEPKRQSMTILTDQHCYKDQQLTYQPTARAYTHDLDGPLKYNKDHALQTQDFVVGPFNSLHKTSIAITSQSNDTLTTLSRNLTSKDNKRKPKSIPFESSTCKTELGKEGCNKPVKNVDVHKVINRKRKKVHSDSVGGSIRWQKLSFSMRKKSYDAKLIKAFQVVKTIGHPMLTLNSEWSLSCYYNLAVAYTTDQPLEMAAACLPELRQAVDIIHSEHFHKLRELKPECQMLLYAVLNCYINWVDHNHKQILLVPGEPSPQQPKDEGDLRCSRCLKNQTFRSSEVNGNPKNIDVEFDFEQLKFGSSCCAATMINVPLSTRDVNTCTFTDLKQMYTSCMKCSQPIFSEVLVDVETLFSRCTVCMANSV